MTNIDPELAETVQHVPAPKAQDAAPSHQASTTKKNNFNLKFWGMIIVAAALLLLGSSIAAVFMAKDMQVDNGLVTTGHQVVKMSVNEVEATTPVDALAFLPAEDARKQVKSVAFQGEDTSESAVGYEKQVASTVIHPPIKSVIERGRVLHDTKTAKTSKAAKSKNTAKTSKAIKSKKTSKAAKSPKEWDYSSEGSLVETFKEANIVRNNLQMAFNFDTETAEECARATDNHQHCIYEVFTLGADFECECRPTSGANVFGEVDANGDDFITLEEILTYFESQSCVFPFTYAFEGVSNTYNECTSVDADFEWCSIKTLNDGSHAKGFYKYCETTSTVESWEAALARLDTDNDGKLSFDEAITNAQRRRRSLLGQGSEAKCNDCVTHDECRNPVIKAIDGECRNYIKTEPLNDNELLRMLAVTMADSYCTTPEDDGWHYNSCPLRRQGMEEWLVQTRLEEYPETATSDGLPALLLCTFLIATTVSPVLVSVHDSLTDIIKSHSDNNMSVVEYCTQKIQDPVLFDGKNAIQWATYTIQKGEHKDKKILAYMGTDFAENEQIAADLFSVPFASEMMRNMGKEATRVAVQEKPDFITGHSLGGILAEMVCAETGISGASFGALGAFDPFSESERDDVDNVGGAESNYKDALTCLGLYTDNEVEEYLKSLDEAALRKMLVKHDYNGLLNNTLHDGVKFEVVINTYDMAQPLSSADGSGCSHIAKSCDIRWTWFGIWRGAGHASAHYAYNTNSFYTTGWEEKSEAKIDYSKIFLPGVTKNHVCDFCTSDDYCESNKCLQSLEQCAGNGDKMPVLCPEESTKSGERSDCGSDNDCVSGRCEAHSNPVYAVLGYGQCYDLEGDGDGCNENSDCVSGRCEAHSNSAWALLGYGQCYDLLGDGEGCNEHTDCESGNCNWLFYCS